jgi:peptidoglycan/xylan/chitin deacetylase (PgdA/CDA1 family)
MKLVRKLLNRLTPTGEEACVLMYHRIATLDSDVWNIAVSPDNFEQQIKLLKQDYNVLPVKELVAALQRRKLQKNSVAITFDDGYADNFLVAKPILDHYGLPATFFVASQTIDTTEEFWWDELEAILLFGEHLPRVFRSAIGGKQLEADLAGETTLSPPLRSQHQRWDACEQAPPTRRSALFLQVWQQLRLLPYPEQQVHLKSLRAWASVAPGARPAFRSMTRQQLELLGNSPLHTLGVHTVSHPALAAHSSSFQRQELLDNQDFLEKVAGKKARIAAYPYGNYNEQTLTVAKETGFEAAFTTEANTINAKSDLYRLGRLQVQNVPLASFQQQLLRGQKRG